MCRADRRGPRDRARHRRARRTNDPCGRRDRKPIYDQGGLISRGRRQLSRRSALPRRARLGADRSRQPRMRRPSESPGTRRTRWARSCSIDPPKVGTHLTKDSPYTEVESVKAVSDVVAPLSGEVIAVNDERSRLSPEKINEDPYGEGLAGARQAVRHRRAGGADGLRRVRGHAVVTPVHVRH